MFHGPLSAGRADRLAAELAASAPATVADYGCGRGELLLRVLTAAPGARGTGVDIHGPDIARGRENAGKRGLADKVIFIEGSAADHGSKADAVINCGAYQAFGRIPEALKALRALVNPGGRVLFGAEIWDRTPTEEWLLANTRTTPRPDRSGTGSMTACRSGCAGTGTQWDSSTSLWVHLSPPEKRLLQQQRPVADGLALPDRGTLA